MSTPARSTLRQGQARPDRQRRPRSCVRSSASSSSTPASSARLTSTQADRHAGQRREPARPRCRQPTKPTHRPSRIVDPYAAQCGLPRDQRGRRAPSPPAAPAADAHRRADLVSDGTSPGASRLLPRLRRDHAGGSRQIALGRRLTDQRHRAGLAASTSPPAPASTAPTTARHGDDQAVIDGEGEASSAAPGGTGFRVALSNPTVIIDGADSRLVADVATNMTGTSGPRAARRRRRTRPRGLRADPQRRSRLANVPHADELATRCSAGARPGRHASTRSALSTPVRPGGVDTPPATSTTSTELPIPRPSTLAAGGRRACDLSAISPMPSRPYALGGTVALAEPDAPPRCQTSASPLHRWRSTGDPLELRATINGSGDSTCSGPPRATPPTTARPSATATPAVPDVGQMGGRREILHAGRRHVELDDPAGPATPTSASSCTTRGTVAFCQTNRRSPTGPSLRTRRWCIDGANSRILIDVRPCSKATPGTQLRPDFATLDLPDRRRRHQHAGSGAGTKR